MGTNLGSARNFQTNYSVNVQKLHKISDDKDYEIFQDSDGNLYEKYQIFIQDSSSIQEQFKKYQLRQGKYDYLVNVYSCKINNRGVEESSYLQIFTERICLTLNQQSRITVQNGLNILLDAAKGFEIIFQKIGQFQINDELIGFNVQGKVKVWINNNWSKNQKINIPQNKKYEISEGHMIIKLLQSVEKHIETSSLMIKWLQQRASIKVWSFYILKKFISQFSFKNEIRLKHNFMLIRAQKEQVRNYQKNQNNLFNKFPIQTNQLHSRTQLKNNAHSFSSFIFQIKNNTSNMSNNKIDFQNKIRNGQPVFLSFDNKRKNNSGKLKNKKNLIYKNGHSSSEKGRINKQFGQRYQPNTEKMKYFKNSLSKQQKINQANTVETLVSQFTIQFPKDSFQVPISLEKNIQLLAKTEQDEYLLTTKITQKNQQNYNFKFIESNEKSIQFKKGIIKRKKTHAKKQKIQANKQINPISYKQSFEQTTKRNSIFNIYKLPKNQQKNKKVEFSLAQKANQKKQRFSLSPNIPHQSKINSKIKSVDQSILIQTNKEEQNASIITFENRPMNIGYGIQEEWQIQFQTQSQQSLPVKSLRFKSIMVQSITLQNSIKKCETRDNQKSLSKLDKILIYQEKAKSREDILIESVHIKNDPGNKTQQREKSYHA